MGWHFRASERLASVLVLSERGVRAGNSQVLERIGMDHLGKLAMDCRVLGWIGMAILVLERMVITKY